MKAGFQAGCNDYVTKPIHRPDLIAKVKSYLANEVVVAGAA